MKKQILKDVEIIDILQNLYTCKSDSLESEKVEFKHFQNENSLYNSKDLAEEICAFANRDGGVVILGVVDSSNIINCNWKEQLAGFDITDFAELKNRLCGKLDPYVDLYIENISFDFKNYPVIHIPKISNMLVATKSGKVYIREGKQSRPMSPIEIETKIKSLHTYDWSAELIDIDILSSLDESCLESARLDYCQRRNIEPINLDKINFLEAIGATKNGKLNRGGLIFLGKKDIIEKYLGSYEYRFSRKTRTGFLLSNEIFSSCIWASIKKLKELFDQFNNEIELEFQSEKHKAPLLDKIAFHEACLNAIVHRDYSIDGMITINFLDDRMIISNPGYFYGGITADNIGYHEPRHRNKILANTLMLFQLVDRAGMGVFRMGLRSLMYGRSFPKFEQINDSISVTMETEYIHPEVFVIAVKYLNDFGIPELLLLNLINQNGYVSIPELEQKLSKISLDPWKLILFSIEKSKLKDYFLMVGNNKGIFIIPNKYFLDYFKSKKHLRASTNSEKHVRLYKHLKDIGEDSNENLKNILGFKHGSSISKFLKKADYIKSKGKSSNTRWFLLK